MNVNVEINSLCLCVLCCKLNVCEVVRTEYKRLCFVSYVIVSFCFLL